MLPLKTTDWKRRAARGSTPTSSSSSSFPPSPPCPRSPHPRFLRSSPLLSSPRLSSALLLDGAFQERTQDGTGGFPFPSDGDGLRRWRRRRDHQVRSAEPTSRGPCEEGLPAPPAAARAGGADATQGSERGDTGGNGAISNLLFVCLC